MDMRYAVVPVGVVVAIVLVLVISGGSPTGTIEPEEPKVGLGISHYDLSNVTVTGETRLVAARVTNTGNLDLNITVAWRQTNGNELNVLVEPNLCLLQEEESVKIYLVVNPTANGVYEGQVEIQGSRSTKKEGSQVVSGGSVHALIKMATKT